MNDDTSTNCLKTQLSAGMQSEENTYKKEINIDMQLHF